MRWPPALKAFNVKLDPQTKRDLMLLAAALTVSVLLAVLTWLVLPPAETGSFLKQPSTFFNAPYGTKAAYLVLEKLGYDVRRLRRPIDYDTLDGFGALVLLRPAHCLNEYEAGVLRDWIRQGHNLLVAPPEEPVWTEEEWNEEREEECAGPYAWFRYAEADSQAEESDKQPDESPPRIHLPEGINDLTAGDDIRFTVEHPLTWPGEESRAEIIWEDESGVVAFQASYGEGRIIALADVYALTNRGLGEGDHPVWLAGLAATLMQDHPAAPLAFDEYHAGFPYQPNPWLAASRLLWDDRWACAVTQVLLMGMLALVANGARFGRPQRPTPRRRRTQGEFTQAAGRFLHAARARDVANSTLNGYYRERLCRALRLPPHTATAELANALRRRGRPEEADLVLQATEGGGAVGESELLQRAQRMEAMLEALEHGAGRIDGARPAHTRRVEQGHRRAG